MAKGIGLVLSLIFGGWLRLAYSSFLGFLIVLTIAALQMQVVYGEFEARLFIIPGLVGLSAGFAIGLSTLITHDREQKLKESEMNYARALIAANAGAFSWEIERDNVEWSSKAYDIFEIPRDTPITQKTVWDRIFPSDREGFGMFTTGHLENRNDSSYEFRIVVPGGSIRHIIIFGETSFKEDGSPDVYRGLVQDNTDRIVLEEQIRKSQKMEAIGQLTGGIAHDFNNLLAVIQGNAELIEDAGGDLSPMASTIVRASERGAELTQRLLAFSRQQPLHPEVICLGNLMVNMLELLKSSLGETVKISTNTQKDLWGALADSGQVENALLNLAINARDAMPKGGHLIIDCANVTLDGNHSVKESNLAAGDYVVLSVTDHGEGMSEDVRKRAFEPFFTTKEIGAGSGLGLSMVSGFAEQSGGEAVIYSEEDEGTTVRLYLPRAQIKAGGQSKPQAEAVPRGLGETILVIEDDPEVRNLAEMMLGNLGYRVICAADANIARQTVESSSGINLILSDVILPGGTSGPEFADELRTSHPEMKVLFMSGYPAEAAKRKGFLDADSMLLNKPFRIAQLAKAVKAALG